MTPKPAKSALSSAEEFDRVAAGGASPRQVIQACNRRMLAWVARARPEEARAAAYDYIRLVRRLTHSSRRDTHNERPNPRTGTRSGHRS